MLGGQSPEEFGDRCARPTTAEHRDSHVTAVVINKAGDDGGTPRNGGFSRHLRHQRGTRKVRSC